MQEVTLRALLEAGCHFGHQTSRWHPKMKPYIFTARDGIHIFDLAETKEGLLAAAEFVKRIAAEGKTIVFVGTKRQAQEIVKEEAKRVGMPYLTERWIGGLFTNWELIKKRIEYLEDLKKKVESGGLKDRTKKENLLIQKEAMRLEKNFGGLVGLKQLPAAVFVVDARKDATALKEAKKRGVVTVAIADTNTDPTNIDYIIPANDDAVRSIQFILRVITEAIEEGKGLKGQEKEVEKKGKEEEVEKVEKVKVEEKEEKREEIEEGEKKKKAKGKKSETSEIKETKKEEVKKSAERRSKK